MKARSFIAKRLASRGSWGRVAALMMLIAALALRISDPTPVELLRLKTFDLYQLMVKPPDLPSQVVIVDIDESSLNRFGQWPWPRTLMAQLVGEITAKAPPRSPSISCSRSMTASRLAQWRTCLPGTTRRWRRG